METIRCGSCGGSIGEDEWDKCPLCGESINGDADEIDEDELLSDHLSAAEEEIEFLKQQNARLHKRIAKLLEQNKGKKKATRRKQRNH
ncbi:MAG: hypothetical protein A2655_04120 [Candidatus Yanofskybacteria bacterium RIFCSPHIGHO2_01_FULL_43_42]|uniref:Uncharacterized protein n=1 Tax=Candidatus Yanofskybacteria bacterium RIFCSPLOWO2_01_FULL_43_22 TaxID=1802695 RepID=A0A1F8GD61_9BACT|nr:MAG: hypothetical protein A2655_04120 [Candidatus Yanofskybacteria bacterium RIFCSPHIGHO2_01_FULL_43_42]OGN12679.1 MAG: hypothetical protein A3D48_01470 [Candidatus Yanofskybacteria bacterium RIFCSPHIGHO2_02_FULL_43_17]OGN23302.1 MAG: hypothetical protein A3A13_04240 [Candidatus Yanofskybacteria bacterium RIFCSPLOWO2_01_FULL_43_22]